MSKTQNLSLKFNNIDTNNFSIDTIEVGKEKTKVHMLRYKNKSLHSTFPVVTISQYGLPPGETLSNGTPNKYWKEGDTRNSIRLPLDVSNSEIAEFVEKAQEIDNYFETNDKIRKQCSVPKKSIYNGIFREPAHTIDAKGETRLPYCNLKFDTDFKTGTIKTDFYIYQADGTWNEMEEPTIEKIESILRLGSKVQPVGEFVKVYVASSAAGGWGPTIKAQAIRVWPSERIERKREKASFVDEDTDESMDESMNESMNKSTITPQVVLTSSSIVDSDEESDNETVQITTGSTKKIAQVESDDSDDDDESEEEVKPVVKAKVNRARTKTQVNSKK